MGRLYRQDGDSKALFGKGANKDRNHVEYIECERHNVHALVEIEEAHERKDGRKVAVEREDQRKEVGQFKVARVCFGKQGTGGAEAKDLAAELLERGAALVVHVGFGNESADGACLLKAEAELDIFTTDEVFIVATYRSEELRAHSHVKATRLVRGQGAFAAAYAPGGEEAGHRKVDGFLKVGEVG